MSTAPISCTCISCSNRLFPFCEKTVEYIASWKTKDLTKTFFSKNYWEKYKIDTPYSQFFTFIADRLPSPLSDFPLYSSSSSDLEKTLSMKEEVKKCQKDKNDPQMVEFKDLLEKKIKFQTYIKNIRASNLGSSVMLWSSGAFIPIGFLFSISLISILGASILLGSIIIRGTNYVTNKAKIKDHKNLFFEIENKAKDILKRYQKKSMRFTFQKRA